MARGQRKTVEEKITEKEALIKALQIRVQSEQKELDALYNEKKVKDLETIEALIKTSGLNEVEVTEALESYVRLKEKSAS